MIVRLLTSSWNVTTNAGSQNDWISRAYIAAEVGENLNDSEAIVQLDFLLIIRLKITSKRKGHQKVPSAFLYCSVVTLI